MRLRDHSILAKQFFQISALMIVFMVGLCLPPNGARAADTLDNAVQEIATDLNARTALGSGGRLKIAITAFPNIDQTTSELSLFIVDLLSTRLLTTPNSKFIVIERSKLQDALHEIKLTETGVVSAGSGITQLGNFLGADALVLGSITVVGDQVFLNARLVRPSTVETITGAESWFPLTPSMQKMIDRPLYVSDPLQDTSDLRSGIWVGQGSCGDNAFGVGFAMVWASDNTIQALQTYFPNASDSKIAPGILEMTGRFNPTTNEITLTPGAWLYQAPGQTAAAIEGHLDPDHNVIQAHYQADNCGKLTLQKQ